MRLVLLGSGLTSLDRLIVLKNRIILTIHDYDTLLKSLYRAFKNNNIQQIHYLQNIESETMGTLTQRVRIFKAYVKNLKNSINTCDCEIEVYTGLDELYKKTEELKEQLISDKNELQREIALVKKSIGTMGRVREETAWRIDIIT